MNLSMAIQDKTNLESIKESYENDKDLIKRSHFQYHYSNSSYISLYLLRLNPFTYNQIKGDGKSHGNLSFGGPFLICSFLCNRRNEICHRFF